jgi:hypothetical protein
LIEALAPSPRPTVIEIKPEEPPAASGAEPSRIVRDGTTNAEPTPEQTAVIGDLHWLVHQGHVIEFADGRMDTAKKPLPRPPKPEAKPTEAKPVTEGEAAPTTVEPEGETPILTEAEIPASEPEPAVEPEPVAEATAETPAPGEPAADAPVNKPVADAPANEPSAEDTPSPS